MKILFDRIDEPGLNTLPVYERRGGYAALRKALGMTPEEVLDKLMGLRHPRPRRRRLPDGPEDLVPAQGRHGQVPRVQRRRVRARHVQGSRDHAEEPAHAGRGDRHRVRTRAEINRAFIYIRGEYDSRPTSSKRRSPRPTRPGTSARRSSAPATLSPRAPSRRRRLHLRRGDGPARLARGQARKPAAEAPVPGDRGPLPRPDADQQRRDALDRAPRSSAWAARSTRRSEPRPRPARSSCRSPATSSDRQLRDRARHPVAGDHLRARRRPRSGREVKLWFPGGSSSPVLTEDDLDIPYDFDSMAKAGSMLGSGAIIVVDDTHTCSRSR